MGIVTKIEEKLEKLVETPFIPKNALDPVGIEIALKRLAYRSRKDVLGIVFVPHSYRISLREDAAKEYEPFLEHFKSHLRESLAFWIAEKGYRTTGTVDLEFIKDRSCRDIFAVNKADVPCAGQRSSIYELIDKRTGRVYAIGDDEVAIGSGEGCSIIIDDESVSEEHVRIYRQDQKVILEDRGSSNGTRLNRRKIAKAFLNDGDKIFISKSELIFRRKG